MTAHGSSEFAAKVRGNLYETLVLDKLRHLSEDMNVLSFVMDSEIAIISDGIFNPNGH